LKTSDLHIFFDYVTIPKNAIPYAYFDESYVAYRIDTDAEKTRLARRMGDVSAVQKVRSPFDLYSELEFEMLCATMFSSCIIRGLN